MLIEAEEAQRLQMELFKRSESGVLEEAKQVVDEGPGPQRNTRGPS